MGDYPLPGGSLRTSSLKMADLEIAEPVSPSREAKAGGMGDRVKTALVTANDRPGLCLTPIR
ncbi:MAG: hypothetical protein ACLTC4_12460 [Hungatella hathewayi]